MKKITAEELLWELSRSFELAGATSLGNDRIEAYAMGRLDDRERARVEKALSRDPVSRSQVGELMGLETMPVVAEVRQRLFESPSLSPVAEVAQAPIWWNQPKLRWSAAAAVIVAALGLGYFQLGQSPTFHPGDAAYSVHVTGGQTAVRGVTQGGSFYPHSRLEIEAYPEQGQFAGDTVSLGLYLLQDGQLERIDSRFEVEQIGSVTRFSAPRIGELVGSDPGLRTLYLSAGTDQMPSTIDLAAAGTTAEAALADAGLWSSALEIEIVAPEQSLN